VAEGQQELWVLASRHCHEVVHPGDDEDLVIWSLKHFSRIVRGDGRAGDLKRKGVRGRLPVDLAAMSHGERSSKLLEHTALASRVFGVLVDGARVVEVTPVVPTV
jgi:hypothetical protein